MPEIWLQYGSSSVVLDIKFENLATRPPSNPSVIPDQEISSSISTLTLTDDLLLLVLSSSRATARIVSEVTRSARAKGVTNYSVDVPSSIASVLKSNLAAQTGESEQISINRIETEASSSPNYLDQRLKKFRTTIAISQTAVDPIFGFAGAPALLVRNFLHTKMTEAFNARPDNLPHPGKEGEPAKIAMTSSEELGISQSIEIAVGGEDHGIVGLHSGNILEAYRNSIAQLLSNSPTPGDLSQTKSAIISASRDVGPHSTLHESLNSLWNCIPNIKEGGSAILVAENRNGIGGGSLQKYVEGRLNQEQISNMPYATGLEHLIFTQQLREKYELGILSSLPKYYLSSQLGFKTFSGMKEVLEKLLQKHGKSTKCLVIPDGDLCLPNWST